MAAELETVWALMALRSCWIDKGDNPDPEKAKKYVLDRPVFDIRDPTLNPQKLLQWRGTAPFSSVGVYACASPDWKLDVATDPGKFANIIDVWLKVIAPNTGAKLPCVSVNIEAAWVAAYPGGIPSYVTYFLSEWRKLRPTRATTLVLDGMQGGWWDNRPEDRAAIAVASLEEIQVEIFGATRKNPDPNGPTLLDPLSELAVVDNLRTRGFINVVPVHDGYRLNQAGAILGDFYGNVFTQGRLV